MYQSRNTTIARRLQCGHPHPPSSWRCLAGATFPYRQLEDAVPYVNARPRPLALYFFSPDGPGRRLVLERTTSGGVAFTETILHCAQDDLPFGGVGASGMSAYHGHQGFKALGHAKGIFEQTALKFTHVVRPPYGGLFERTVEFLLR